MFVGVGFTSIGKVVCDIFCGGNDAREMQVGRGEGCMRERKVCSILCELVDGNSCVCMYSRTLASTKRGYTVRSTPGRVGDWVSEALGRGVGADFDRGVGALFRTWKKNLLVVMRRHCARDCTGPPGVPKGTVCHWRCSSPKAAVRRYPSKLRRVTVT